MFSIFTNRTNQSKHSAVKIAVFLILFFVLSNSFSAQPAFNITDIVFANVNTVLMTGENGLILKSENGGINWTEQSIYVTNTFFAAGFASYTASSNTVLLHIAAGENGLIARSEDNGSSWVLDTFTTEANLYDILVYDENTYFISGSEGTIIKSTNHAVSWESAIFNSASDFYCIASFPTSSARAINILAAGSGGTCFATINMVDWFSLNIPAGEDILSISTSGNSAVCGTGTGNIIRTTNRGISWEVINSGLSSPILKIRHSDENNITGTSTLGKIIRSTNGGINWEIIVTPVFQYLSGLDFGSSTFGLAGGTTDSLLYTTNGGINWLISFNCSASKKTVQPVIKSLKNFPNPFNPVTTINYDLHIDGNVKLTVYDINGKEAATLVNTNQLKGSHSVKFDAGSMASGIYFYILRVNNGKNSYSETNKMILTK